MTNPKGEVSGPKSKLTKPEISLRLSCKAQLIIYNGEGGRWYFSCHFEFCVNHSKYDSFTHDEDTEREGL